MEIQSTGLFTGNKDIYTKDQWSRLYPQSEYKNRSNYALHFLIAYGTDVIKYVGTLKEKNPERLTQNDPLNQNLTPLHLATMKANTAVAELLLDTCKTTEQKKKMINAQDKKGYTPLHFAAITSDSLFRRFLELGGNANIKVNNGMNCNDLLILTGRAADIRSKKTLFVLDQDSNKLVLLANASDSLKEKIFGKEFFFTDSPLFAPERFHKIWDKEETEITEVNDLLFPLYEKFKKNPPSIIIDRCKELIDISNSFEGRAVNKIQSGTIISEYSGKYEEILLIDKFIDHFSENTIQAIEYSLTGINARNAGSESRFFNCGFPNAIVAPIQVNGNDRGIIMSLNDIEPGEAILFDYGIESKYLVFGAQVLLGKEKMVSFFQQHKDTVLGSLEGVKKRDANRGKVKYKISGLVENWKITAPSHYVLGCPTAMLFLHFSNIMDYTFWKNGLDGNLFEGWKKKHSSSSLYLQLIFDTLNELDSLTSNMPEIKNSINTWVLQKLEKESVIHILKGLDLLNERDNIDAHDELDRSLAEIDQFLATYDWKNDLENFPFNIERVANSLALSYKSYPRKDTMLAIVEHLKKLDENSETYKINRLVVNKLYNDWQ